MLDECVFAINYITQSLLFLADVRLNSEQVNHHHAFLPAPGNKKQHEKIQVGPKVTHVVELDTVARLSTQPGYSIIKPDVVLPARGS